MGRNDSKIDEWSTPEKIAQIGEWFGSGMTLQQVADNIGISRRALFKWRDKNPEIDKVLTTERGTAVKHVENALYERALGYSYTETKTVTRADPRWEDGTITEVTVTEKHQPADTVAQIFFLKNRDPENWRDRRDIDLSGTVGLVQIVDDIGGDDLIGDAE